MMNVLNSFVFTDLLITVKGKDDRLYTDTENDTALTTF